jgi:hypothetical protein
VRQLQTGGTAELGITSASARRVPPQSSCTRSEASAQSALM